MGGMDPDLQPRGVVPDLSQRGLLALPPAAGAQLQHLVLLLLQLLRLRGQDRLSSPRDQGAGKIHLIYVLKVAFAPASKRQ